ncbi:MAG: VWA domain-containing protein, partial [Thermoanaerobaculia bacterium]|nr:VWA domain-containing protein [Thermoanaerobaculia bacterium]
FLELEQDYQRQEFRRRFWELRDPYPRTTRNELREQWHRRWKEASERWDDPRDGRFRTYLLHGPPAERIDPRCGGALRAVEVWTYPGSILLAQSFSLVFVPEQGDRYRIWSPREGLSSLALLAGPVARGDQALVRRLRAECIRGDRLLGPILGALDWPSLEERILDAVQPDPEWAAAFRVRSTSLPEEAQTFTAELDLRFPRRHQSRTVVQALLSVSSSSVESVTTEAGTRFDLVLDGEVLRRETLFESFRYRFEIPRDRLAGGKIPLVFERYLRPGDYRLILRVRDIHGDRYFRESKRVSVPLVTDFRPLEPTSLPGPKFDRRREEAEASVEIYPPPEELQTGLVRIGAQVRGGEVDRVRFDLDGEPVLSKGSPPWEVELDLGRAPRLHRVRAVALDRTGEPVASDEIALNAGPHRFTVRLVQPRPRLDLPEELRARAAVEVPRGARLDRVELYLDETRLATLYQPPFVQELPPPPDREMSYVRAVAYLESGASAEDLVFLRAPENLEELDVQVVELYTTVVDRRGRPVRDLGEEDFRILEDGREQEILRFAWVEDVPLHAGILLDTSNSMTEEIDEAERAALGFFREILTPRDRAGVITFADRPRLRVPFTNRIDVLAGGLANLEVDGETALYDSLIYALYYFSGIEGKRLLVLISDGEDVESEYDIEETLEFARRTGVAIYPIGLGLDPSDQQARTGLLRLASETGGRAFFVDRAAGLGRVYRDIEREIRSQYLLTYQSDGRDPERFRKVRIEVDEPGLEARTIEGYYP